MSDSETAEAIPALPKLLPALPNLHTIHALHCNKARDIAEAVKGLRLLSVRTLVIPTKCSSLIEVCPNVTHVRCAGGNGAALISALKFCKVEVLDGMIDWRSEDVVNRKHAPFAQVSRLTPLC